MRDSTYTILFYGTFTKLLKRSSSSAAIMPTAIQIRLITADRGSVNPENGIVITVAAITIPMIPWKAAE